MAGARMERNGKTAGIFRQGLVKYEFTLAFGYF